LHADSLHCFIGIRLAAAPISYCQQFSYLRRVSSRRMEPVRLFVSRITPKIYERILINSCGGAGHGTKRKCLDFGGNPNSFVDYGILYRW